MEADHELFYDVGTMTFLKAESVLYIPMLCTH